MYRLPTEAEWEYACRAGTTTRYFFGDSDALLDKYAWYKGNAKGKTHLVCKKKANQWGLYDMIGNVWEWCQDGYNEAYYKDSSTVDRQGQATGQYRVLRGGSWLNVSTRCRSAARFYNGPGARSANFGFRVMARALTT
jgi:formylglycine-generating enzyme required for sulfatase activity